MILERLESIQKEIGQFPDGFSRYAFLVELSAYISPEQPELMVEKNRYQGCQSQVWLWMDKKDDIFFMKATSDTLIIRGILYVMMELYNGCRVEEILDAPVDLLKSCGIEEHFSSERSAGIRGISQKIYEFCSSL